MPSPFCLPRFLLNSFCLLFMFSAPESVLAQRAGNSLYVAVDGNDGATGTIDAPLKTIERARDIVRTKNAGMATDITVNLRGGTYYLKEPLHFEPLDSGSNNHYVIYQSYSGEKAIISGGRPIVDWMLHDAERNIWKAQAGDLNTRQLYVNGKRAIRARSKGPLPGAIATENGFTTTDTAMAAWRNIGDIEFVFNAMWNQPRCGVEKIEGASITMKQPGLDMCRHKAGTVVDLPEWIENAYELLDSEGEWYLDRAEKMIYYKPRAGEDMASSTVIAPVLETLISGDGGIDKPVHHLRFEGLTFSHATWLRPNDNNGFAEIQICFCRHPQATVANNWEMDTWVKTPANITFKYGKSIIFEQNRFSHLGACGLGFEAGSQGNMIAGNEFTDISASAIQLGDGNNNMPKDKRDILRDNAVSNNYIHHIGAEYPGGVAIAVLYGQGTQILHNEIAHLPYTGISIGWGWGAPSIARDSIIAYNHIHDYMSALIDGGGIYSLGSQPGNIYHSNWIHNQNNYFGGIYLDDGARHITVMNNVVQDAPMNILVKGSDHTIQRNFWNIERNVGHPLAPWIADVPTRLPYDKEPNFTWQISHNTYVATPEVMPASITGHAGLERQYREFFGMWDKPSTVTLAAPEGLASTTQTESTADLKWNPAAASEAVTGYEILCDGRLIGVSASPSYRATGLSPKTEYEFAIRARNAAGILSPASASVKAGTTKSSDNLALDKPALGYHGEGHTDFLEGHDLWTALDGDPDSYAQAARDREWKLVVDLGKPQKVRRISLMIPASIPPEALAKILAYSIEYSSDRKDWKPLGQIGDFIANSAELKTKATSARFIRVAAIRKKEYESAGAMAISELGVYEQ